LCFHRVDLILTAVFLYLFFGEGSTIKKRINSLNGSLQLICLFIPRTSIVLELRLEICYCSSNCRKTLNEWKETKQMHHYFWREIVMFLLDFEVMVIKLCVTKKFLLVWICTASTYPPGWNSDGRVKGHS